MSRAGKEIKSMATETIEPVSRPSAYTTMILEVLGEDDPAEVQARTPAAVRQLLVDAGPLLRQRPDPGEWSVLELIGHIFDAELVVGARYRWILAENQPDIVPYDQDLWVARLDHNDAEPEELIAPFEALRAANLRLWQRIPVEDRARFGIHRERGPESYELTFRLLAGHDRFHLEQARATLGAVRAASGRLEATTEVR
jgi:hypothetical protein